MKRAGVVVMLCVGVLFFAADTLLPKEVAQGSSPKERAEEFLTMIKSGKISEGYDKLFEGSSISADKPQAITMLKQQTSMVSMYGEIFDYELIVEEQFGTSLIRFVYLLKSEKVPTTWEFYFYKPKDSWFLSNIIFSDQFQLLSAKK
jgi:hypothetical protein